MSVHLKLLVEGEDLPLLEGAVLDGGADPLPILAFIALCAIDNLSTSNKYRSVSKQAHDIVHNLVHHQECT